MKQSPVVSKVNISLYVVPGVTHIISSHSALLYRFIYSCFLVELFDKTREDLIFYISTKPVPISLLSNVLNQEQLENVLIRVVHSIEELLAVLSRKIKVIMKNKSGKNNVRYIVIDSVDHLFYEIDSTKNKKERFEKIMTELRYYSIRKGTTIFCVSKEKKFLIHEEFMQSNHSSEKIADLDYLFNSKLIIWKKSDTFLVEKRSRVNRDPTRLESSVKSIILNPSGTAPLILHEDSFSDSKDR